MVEAVEGDTDDGSDDEVQGMASGLSAAVRSGKSPRVQPRNPNGDKPLGSTAWRFTGGASGVSREAPIGGVDASVSTNSDTVSGFNAGSELVDAARVSSSPRISQDDAHAHTGAVDGSKGDKPTTHVHGNAAKSYASILNASSSSKGNSLTFFPLSAKSDSKVEIPLELLKQSTVVYQNTLYGYFLGPRLYFPTVVKEVKRMWGKLGFQEAMMNDHGFLFFRFSAVDGLRQVLEGGPWMIRGVPLFVFPWDPLQGLEKPEHKSCPLWVKLHNIPLAAFNREGVSRIASALGEPKMMDDHTTAMCDNAWGRPGFAKVLVDVWAVGELKKELTVVVPNMHGGKGVSVKIQVEYLWEPSQCSHCQVFGHKVGSCVKAAAVKIAQKGKGKGTQEGGDDGFTVVRNRKAKGVVISEPAPSKPGKVKQVYVPVNKPDRGSRATSSSTGNDSGPNGQSYSMGANGTIQKDPVATIGEEPIRKDATKAAGENVNSSQPPPIPVVADASLGGGTEAADVVQPSVRVDATNSETSEPFATLENMASRGKPLLAPNTFSALSDLGDVEGWDSEPRVSGELDATPKHPQC